MAKAKKLKATRAPKAPKDANAPRKAKRMSYKDVQIAYLAGGVADVEKLLKDGKTSKSAVRKALAAFQAQGSGAVTQLEAFTAEHMPAGSRGRVGPQSGTERAYRAQKLETGGCFLRLPLEVLGVSKGASVNVRFDADRIVVSKRAA